MASHPEDFDDDFEPFFVACLPENYASLEQKSKFYKIIRSYNKEYLYFGRYSNESGYLEDGELVDNYVLQDDLMKSTLIGKKR